MRDLVLGIDQGTTGTTAVLVDASGRLVASRNVEVPNHFPAPERVEHDAEEIWASVAKAVTLVLEGVGAERLTAIGLTNQRETSLFFDAKSGRAANRALVWQDRRTTARCEELRSEGYEESIKAKTGLLLDPYFSATKAEWMLRNVPGLAAGVATGAALFGTVDTYVAFRLSGEHVTDASNASRTLLFDIHQMTWDEELLGVFGVPSACLPRVVDSAGVFGRTRGAGFLPDGIPLSGIAGDQQAALFGQACFTAGLSKVTYGTGAFVLLNTGEKCVASRHGLLSTVAWRLAGKTTYALEGSAFIAGAAVQWLRDGLGLIASASEVEALAASVPDSGGVTFVPALTGLGAPYWRPEARGLLSGLTRGTTRAHVARAVLEGVALQVADILEAMAEDAGVPLAGLRVDGGAARNDLLMQEQADLLGVPCVRPTQVETTAIGAAYLAGLGVGLYESPAALARAWQEERRFMPRKEREGTKELRRRWREAVAKA